MHLYGQAAARSYAAYRPPLHRRLLAAALADLRFQQALDVGCGVGWSTIALADRCRSVLGVDPSAPMLSAAIARPNVAYRLADAVAMPIEAQEFDLVTIAGALPYIDRERFVPELRRVCRPAATIMPYDFRVDLRGLARRLSLPLAPASAKYDHAADFARDPRFETLTAEAGRMSFLATPQEASHLFLANETRLRAAAERYQAADPAPWVAEALAADGEGVELEASVWFAVHRLRESASPGAFPGA